MSQLQFLLPGQGGKPADVFLPHWEQGEDAALDVTVVNPLQDALVDGAAQTPGHALRGEYFSICRDTCPCIIFFSRAVIFKSGCFVQKYWSGTVTRNIKENMTWIQ